MVNCFGNVSTLKAFRKSLCASRRVEETLCTPKWHSEDKVEAVEKETEARIKSDLKSEIEALEKRYETIQNYLAGAEMENFEIVGALQTWKDDLSTVSAHILTLYQLKGQRTKITWESLFTNIDTALETIRNSPRAKPRATIEMAFDMSDPKVGDVMAYLAKLKQSL